MTEVSLAHRQTAKIWVGANFGCLQKLTFQRFSIWPSFKEQADFGGKISFAALNF